MNCLSDMAPTLVNAPIGTTARCPHCGALFVVAYLRQHGAYWHTMPAERVPVTLESSGAVSVDARGLLRSPKVRDTIEKLKTATRRPA